MTTLGIDLGTTYSAIGVMEGNKPRLIPNTLASVLTPSVVGLTDGGTILVGQPALELSITSPTCCASVFKRYMGGTWKKKLGNQEFTAEQLSSFVLRALKRDAEHTLKTSVESVVITVPAYFNESQRRATMHAGRLAGLRVARILNEPTAAAIAYGLHDGDHDKTIAVIDLGGGTFDVSIVEFFDGTLEVRASSGEAFLGGEDFTQSLASKVLEQNGLVFERVEFESPLLTARMRAECERAKRALSVRSQAKVRIPNRNGELTEDSLCVDVTAEQFQEWTASTLDQVHAPISRALRDAKLAASEVDEVILVGGATNMPLLRKRMTELFGKEPRFSINPDEVVAMGATAQAGLIDQNMGLKDMVVTDVAPFTLGIGVSKSFGTVVRNGYFNPIINRNTTIPISLSQDYGTMENNQTEVRVSIYQGENRMLEDNHKLGELRVTGIPPGPPRKAISVRFTYDLNGVLEVESTVLETGEVFQHVITRDGEDMSEASLQQAIEEMQSLKMHPRDDEVNRLLMYRAAALFRELPASQRDRLEQLIDGFEGALETSDTNIICRHKKALEQFLANFTDET